MRKKLFSLSLVLPAFLFADQIVLDSGETLRGQLIDFNAGFISLRLPESQGEALRRISPEKIRKLEFNDEGVPLEIRARKRAKFLPILPEEDAQILLQYLQSLLDQTHSATALNLAKTWYPQNQYTSLDPQYRTILIESALASNRPNEALVHSRNWLELKPPPFKHPLPWRVLAQNQLDSNVPKAALKTALTPIAHASFQDRDQLKPLHDLAAQAYQILGYPDHANAHLSSDPNKLLEIASPLQLSLAANP